ncbi:MAG: FAD-binding oxidoreductase [Deltaproteobacteria bacterium]|nr:MAG: FAD-binding oxidoreductase [Deltaproteobacteria bacterium]
MSRAGGDRASARAALAEAFGADRIDGDAPLVARVADEEEAACAVRIATEHGLSVGPAGAVGRWDLVLDLSALADVAVHADSHLVEVGAGVSPAALEARLGDSGLTLGWSWLPEVPMGVLLGAEERGPEGSHAFPGWSPVAAVRAVLPDGRLFASKCAPRSAVGPDLKALIVGCLLDDRTQAAILTHVTLRVRPRPAMIRRLVFAFPEYGAAVGALAEALARDLVPDRVGLLDGGSRESILTWESHGEPRVAALRAAVVDEVCGLAGGRRLSTQARTRLERIAGNDEGAAGSGEVRAKAAEAPSLPETVLASCRWSQLASLRRALIEAFSGRVRVHVERALPEGPVALACVAAGAGGTARARIVQAGGRVGPSRVEEEILTRILRDA